jgi:hypothetical protein
VDEMRSHYKNTCFALPELFTAGSYSALKSSLLKSKIMQIFQTNTQFHKTMVPNFTHFPVTPNWG